MSEPVQSIEDEVNALVRSGEIDAVAPHVRPPEPVPEHAGLWARLVYLWRLWRWRRAERAAEDEVQSAVTLLTCFGERALARRVEPAESPVAAIIAAVRAESEDFYRLKAVPMRVNGMLSTEEVRQILCEFETDYYRVDALFKLCEHIRNPEHWYELLRAFDSGYHRARARNLCPERWRQ